METVRVDPQNPYLMLYCRLCILHFHQTLETHTAAPHNQYPDIDVTSPGQPILHSAISHWQSNYAKGRFECLPLAVHQEPVETCNEKLSR